METGQKKYPCPTMGQELFSCGTTQIDIFMPAFFTYHHTCPDYNGGVPVGYCAALGSPFT